MKKILYIASDNQSLVVAVTRITELLKYIGVAVHIDTAINVDEAITYVKASRYDHIFIGNPLPESDWVTLEESIIHIDNNVPVTAVYETTMQPENTIIRYEQGNEIDAPAIVDHLDEIKKAFIDNISHELRTPVTIIKEAISLIADQSLGQINSEQQHVIAMALENVDRLIKIINQLLDISQLDGGIADVCLEPTDLSQVLNDVYDRFKLKASQKSIHFDLTYDPLMPVLTTDRKKVVKILSNLVENAVRFSEKGNRIKISSVCNSNSIDIKVEDTGCGIPEDELERIFEKFYQLNKDSRAKEQGIGLGLSITQRLVEMLNGTITVTSEEGNGTVFTVTLPVNVRQLK